MASNGDQRDLAGLSVLITGGSSGVGLEFAKQALEQGAKIMLLGSDPVKLNRAVETLPESQVAIYAGDVSDSETADGAIKSCREIFSQPTSILINCAGTILRETAANTSDQDWDRVMRVNVNGVFYFSRAFANQSDLESGAIVNVSSTCGQVGAVGLAAYCASKGAVDQLTRTLALELAAKDINVNAVAPGAINSPMLYSKHNEGVADSDVSQRNIAAIPVGALAEPQEVARAILFLATQRHISGTILSVDGGYTAQ